ncbi:hypothetical protein V5O48_017594 [Marasmius crinis-equi]|uniref:Uncharacterized protein n=1 Tax=Marasmius crinis-equi TaxID=585013 RepID=A0ABR3ENN4_9AGAR
MPFIDKNKILFAGFFVLNLHKQRTHVITLSSLFLAGILTGAMSAVSVLSQKLMVLCGLLAAAFAILGAMIGMGADIQMAYKRWKDANYGPHLPKWNDPCSSAGSNSPPPAYYVHHEQSGAFVPQTVTAHDLEAPVDQVLPATNTEARNTIPEDRDRSKRAILRRIPRDRRVLRNRKRRGVPLRLATLLRSQRVLLGESDVTGTDARAWADVVVQNGVEVVLDSQAEACRDETCVDASPPGRSSPPHHRNDEAHISRSGSSVDLPRTPDRRRSSRNSPSNVFLHGNGITANDQVGLEEAGPSIGISRAADSVSTISPGEDIPVASHINFNLEQASSFSAVRHGFSGANVQNTNSGSPPIVINNNGTGIVKLIQYTRPGRMPYQYARRSGSDEH